MTQDGKWLEQMKSFLTLAHQATCIAAEANPDAQRDFLQKIVSNLKLFNKTLIVSYASEFKTVAEIRCENMGSLSYCTRGNLSEFINLIICAIPQYIKNILPLERLFPRQICPFCPVFFIPKSPISIKF